jgi:hypothetical protein
VAFVPNEQVIEAVPPKRADDTLAERVGSRRSRWCEKLLDSQTAHPTLISCAIDAVAIVQEEPWRRMLADRVDDALVAPYTPTTATARRRS